MWGAGCVGALLGQGRTTATETTSGGPPPRRIAREVPDQRSFNKPEEERKESTLTRGFVTDVGLERLEGVISTYLDKVRLANELHRRCKAWVSPEDPCATQASRP